MDHICTKEAEIATLKAHLETSVEVRRNQYEDLKGELKTVLVILRGDGNGTKGIMTRLGKIEDMLMSPVPAAPEATKEAEDKPDNCLYLNVGKMRFKIPMSRSALKILGCGAVIILMLTGQININSPLAQDLIGGVIKLIGG
jgi:hypothetical protein